MFYRLAITLGLLILPLASAEAAYQQNYRLPANSSSSSTSSTPEQRTGQSMSEETEAVETMNEVVSPWELDGNMTMTRGTFTAQLVRSRYTQGQIDSCFWSIAPTLPPHFTLVFTDVSVTDLYAKEICIAMRDGLVRGYIDGSFGPDRILTFAESAKILSRAYVLAPYAHADVRSPWYAGHVRALVARNAVPVSITRLSQLVTASEVKEMIERLEGDITWRPAQSEEVLFPPVVTRQAAPVFVPVVPPTTSPSPSSQSSSQISTPKSSAASVPSSDASSQMPASSAASKEGSFWDLF